MRTPEADIDERIGARVREFRAAKGLTLDDLAASSGVSRAMLSRIERAQSSATAQLLVRLCGGLGVTLSDLVAAAPAAPSPLRRAAGHPLWRDPATGYRRREIAPADLGPRASIVEIEFPAGARVALDNRRYAGRGQHVWLIDGELEIEAGGVVHRLNAGDRLTMAFGGKIVFRNPARKRARYAVIADTGE
jgi:transcriptional regulator with XRE-family HTH domain